MSWNRKEYRREDIPNLEAECSDKSLTFIWRLMDRNIHTSWTGDDNVKYIWAINCGQAFDLIEYLKAIRQAHSTDGSIWRISAEGKQAVKGYADELIASFPELAPQVKPTTKAVTPQAPIIAVKPTFGQATPPPQVAPVEVQAKAKATVASRIAKRQATRPEQRHGEVTTIKVASPPTPQHVKVAISKPSGLIPIGK